MDKSLIDTISKFNTLPKIGSSHGASIQVCVIKPWNIFFKVTDNEGLTYTCPTAKGIDELIERLQEAKVLYQQALLTEKLTGESNE